MWSCGVEKQIYIYGLARIVKSLLGAWDMEDSCGLLCHESGSCLIDGGDGDEEEEAGLVLAEADDEYVRLLVAKEVDFGRKCGGFDDDADGDWWKCSRREAVRWILKARLIFGFSDLTAYLAITYFDRFISIRFIEKDKCWATRLLSVACLSLAAKMEECKVPALSEFRHEDYPFDCKVIQRMELLVSSTFDWRLNTMTPFAYLSYFAIKVSSESKPKVLVTKAVDFLLGAVEDMNTIEHRPSAIAAASIFVALDQMLSKNAVINKIEAMLPPELLDNDHVYACYSMLRELKLKPSKLVIASDWSPVHSTSVFDVPDQTSVGSVTNKKRRLAFDDGKPIS